MTRHVKQGGTDYGFKTAEVRGGRLVNLRPVTARDVRVLINGIPLEPAKSFRLRKPRPLPLKVRIARAMRGHLQRDYHDLMRAVFPPAEYPRAYRYQANGGPPGCAMAFGRALRELGATWAQDDRRVFATPAMRQLDDRVG